VRRGLVLVELVDRLATAAADEKFIDWAAEVDLRCVPADDHAA
jgi:hypothetical protein